MQKRPRTKLVRVQAGKLRVHPSAQRVLNPTKLGKIIERTNLDAIGVLHAVEYAINRVNATWIVDGQHRWSALMHHGMGEWECEVMVHLDVKDDEAAHQLFLDLNTRAAVGPYDKFMNELGAGHEVAVGVDRIVRRHGFKIDRQASDGHITCVEALKTIYEKDEGRALALTIETAKEAWGRRAGAVEGQVLKGIGSVFATYNGGVDRDALIKKLAKYPGGPSGIVSSARALKSLRSASVAKCVEEVVVEAYNKGRRTGLLEVS